jgi:hypothetical protein
MNPTHEREALAMALGEAEKGLQLAQKRRDWAAVEAHRARLIALERAAQALLSAEFAGTSRLPS